LNRLDGLRLEIIFPLLSLGSGQGLHVNITCSANNSLHWHLGLDVEWFVYSKSINHVSGVFLHLIDVDNRPSLEFTVVLLPSHDLSAFQIRMSFNINNLVIVDILEESIFEFEELPPSGAGGSDDNVSFSICVSTILELE
jgi:hypothetical protein